MGNRKMKISIAHIMTMLCFIGVSLNVLAEDIKMTEERQRLSFNTGWLFYLGDATGAEKTNFNDASWRQLRIPHDWSIEEPFDQNASSGGAGGYVTTGIGWYRKHFNISATSQTVWIEFDGVYMNSEVWINDHYLGKWVYGYTSFHYDLTPYLKEGENVLAVKVDNSIQRNSRWYSGSGIYRNIWLNISHPVHISQWGTYVTTPVINDTVALVAVRVTAENNTSVSRNVRLTNQVIDKNGKVVATSEAEITILAKDKHDDYRQELSVLKPLLWSIGHPDLYTLRTSIILNDKVIDKVDTRFGIRSLNFTADKGLLLNGKQVKMNGVNLHHDAGCLGTAVPVQVWERRLKILKDMGCNSIRTAHNPMAPEFLDLCDELGFFVMNEFVDEWLVSKAQTTSAYSLYFRENWIKDVTAFIHRDRNHPSVAIWSAGNEIRDEMYPEGIDVVKDLVALFHREDPTRPVTQGNDQIVAEPLPALDEFLAALDIVGYNYVGRWRERAELLYTPDKIKFPDRLVIGTENGGVRGMRSSFSLGDNPKVVTPNYISGLAGQQLWKYTAVHDFVIGDHMWTGIDYLGEARWPSRGAGSGQIDLAGFVKSSYYFYQSQWTNKPTVHLFPHWNWEGRDGQVIPVLAYTNCDEVELFVNGKSFGLQRLEFPSYGMAGRYGSRDRPAVQATTKDLHAYWTVPYAPGEIKVVGKIQGQVVATDIVQTFGKPASLRVTVDKSTIRANGDDIAHVTVEIVDSNGRLVQTANNEIKMAVKGDARLLGMESGNNRDMNSGNFRKLAAGQPASKEAFYGLLLGYIQAGMKAGSITVEVSSPGLKSAQIAILII